MVPTRTSSPPGTLHTVSTPVGPVGLFLAAGRLEGIRLPLPPLPGGRESQPAPERLAEAVAAWFAGDEGPLRGFPRRLAGTPFQERIWRAALAIPRGEVRTYGGTARAAGLGRGHARAVGAALRANPLPLVVPCHRVVGAGERLVGFSGSEQAGLELKRRLLALEGIKCEMWP